MSRYARFGHLRVDKPDEAGVVELVLDAPNLNAVSEGAHGDLAEVWREFDADPEVRAVLLRGAGRGFSAAVEHLVPARRRVDLRRVAEVREGLASHREHRQPRF